MVEASENLTEEILRLMMSDYLRHMDQQEMAVSGPLMNPIGYVPPNLKEQLTRRLEDAQQRVDDITAAVALLDKNPDIEQLLSLLGRTGL